MRSRLAIAPFATVALFLSFTSACVTLSATQVEGVMPGKRLPPHIVSTRVEEPALQLTDVDFRPGELSARVVHASTCDAAYFDRTAEIKARYTSYPASPWTMIGAEVALTAATLFEGGICTSGSNACTGIASGDRGSVGTVLIGLGAAVGITALIDTLFVTTRAAPSFETVERERLVCTARETCEVQPVRDTVGMITYNGRSRHFLTDGQGRFLLGGAMGLEASLYVEVEVNDEAAWLDLGTARARASRHGQ